MAWTLDGQRIYVEKDTGWQLQPRIGEIDVLDSTETLYHYAGKPSPTRTLVFVVLSGYHTNIYPLADGTGKALVSDQGAEGSVIIKNIKADRLQDIKRADAVFRVTTELKKVGS